MASILYVNNNQKDITYMISSEIERFDITNVSYS